MKYTNKKVLNSKVQGKELDDYLSRGWYRNGKNIYTCDFLLLENKFGSVFWIRSLLKDYQLSKSLRKIKRKVLQSFTFEVRPYQDSKEKKELFEYYTNSFNGNISSSLDAYLSNIDGKSTNFNTHEVLVRDEGKLIANSIFDVGKKSIASILGYYNPDYKKYSLGLFTMIIELEFALKHNMDFFYPGYIYTENERFDYKIRMGNTEYLNLESNLWTSFGKKEDIGVPHLRIQEKLENLKLLLVKSNIESKLFFNPFFDFILQGFTPDYFDAPYFLDIQTNINFFRLVITFDFKENKFIILNLGKFNMHKDFIPSYILATKFAYDFDTNWDLFYVSNELASFQSEIDVLDYFNSNFEK